MSSKFRIPSLRLYLREHSKFRGEDAGSDVSESSLIGKSRSTMNTIALFNAALSLLILVIIRFEVKDLSEFQMVLRPIIIFLALLTVMLFVFSIDLLDSISNQFEEKKDGINDIEKKLYFYRKIGNLWPKGAISYTYFGYALYTIIIVMTLAFLDHRFTGFLLGAFVYLGYPILFGYKFEGNVSKVDDGKKSKVISIIVALIVLISATLIIICPLGS